MSTAQVVDLDEARAAALSKVYSCGKCKEQGAMLLQDGHILCGGEDCDARMAASWYASTKLTDIAVHSRPRGRIVDGSTVRYYCAYCGYGYFHMHQDQSFTCYNERCKKTPLFRWAWHNPSAAA